MLPRISRRHFLQAAGTTLAALGWAQADILQQGDRYGGALAQSTSRKLALLVGINAYPKNALFPPLNGCVTDVELQYHLLVHRFGFKPSNIIKLTDQQATRDAILTAFEEHIIKQAKPGDVAVFHFSGHGSRVIDPDNDFPDGLNGTLVPIDSPLPPGFPREGGPVDDITGHTLFLLGKAVPTENFTMVLDSCHSGGAKRTQGNFVIRARDGGNGLTMSEAEQAYQAQWLSKLDLSPNEFIEQRRAGIAKGVAIASAKRDQFAADAPFEDFYAGAFSYVLTQYLWQQTGAASFDATIGNVARTTTQVSFSGQQPQFEVQPGSGHNARPIYFTQQAGTPAEAVIVNIQGSDAEIWLGGVNSRSLEAFEQGAVLSGVDATGQSRGLVRLTGRQGLTGRGQLLETTLASGALLQEQTRGVPTNVTLRIGLDSSLEEDISTARQALMAIPRIEPRVLGQGEVHYILGRMTPDYRFQLAGQPDLPPANSIGLFSQGLDLVPGSYGIPGESVTAAVTRLRSKLRSLLAARIVKLTLNPGSSRLDLRVLMKAASIGTELSASPFRIRGLDEVNRAQSANEQFPVNMPIQFTIANNESRDLYLSVLTINAHGEMAVLFPNQWTASIESTLLPAGSTLLLPDENKDAFKLVTQGPKGTTEVLIVASSQPLSNALSALQDIATSSGVRAGPMALTDPTELVDNLIQDVGATSRGAETPASIQPVDVSELAALSLTFDVV